MASMKLKRTAAVLAICAPLTAGFEGLRHTVYLDPIGVKTYCVGETRNPQNRVYSTKECMDMLDGRLAEFYGAVAACITRDMPDPVAAAFTDLAYNIGSGGFCRSSVARLWNEGRTKEACDDMLRFNRAGGIVFPGLTRRREAERDLCRQGA